MRSRATGTGASVATGGSAAAVDGTTRPNRTRSRPSSLARYSARSAASSSAAKVVVGVASTRLVDQADADGHPEVGTIGQGRAHRIGHRRRVTVEQRDQFLAADPADDRAIAARSDRKAATCCSTASPWA